MSQKITGKKIFIISIVLLTQLAFLYYSKYLNQKLSLDDFSIVNTGNVFNFLIYAGIVFGIFLLNRMKKNPAGATLIYSLISISWVLLIFSFISTRFVILPADSYFLNQPIDKILSGVLFLIYLISLIYLLIYIWYSLIIKNAPTLFKVLMFTFISLISFFIVILVYIDNSGYASERWALSRNKKNIAVVLGAAVWSGNIPSPTLSARVDKSIDLLNNGFVGEIVLTGGKAPGELAESEVAFEYSKARGVDSALIRIEDSTSSTTDQIRWIKNNLVNQGIGGDIILISDAYHLPRAIEISKFFNIDVKVAESVHKLTYEDMLYNKIRESIALFNFWNFAL